jgi:hypothetical protein
MALWKEITVLDTIYSISRARASMNSVTLVRLWRKFVPDLEDDDLHSISDEEINKSEILEVVCAMRSFENVNEETKNGYRVMRMNWACST